MQYLLALAEVPKEEVQGAAHQWRILVHCEMDEHAEKGAAAIAVQVDLVAEDLLRLLADPVQVDALLADAHTALLAFFTCSICLC